MNVGASVGDPRQEFYVREDKNDELFGPLTFQHAVAQARALSLNEEKSGLAEICTYVGASDRPGDPIKSPSVLFVAYMYIRGKRTLGGRTAQYHSDRQLPPTS